VALESIPAAFRGVIPSPYATCAADGTPNITYMSLVHYVDSDRVALSRQFFDKTRSNLDANPRSQVRVVDPETFREYMLDLEYVLTEAHGPVYEAVSANIEAIASQSGMSGVFRLRGVDIHRVVRCAHVAGSGLALAPTTERNVLGQLDELTRRLALCADYGEATRTALESLDDLFGFRQSILFVPERDALVAVADNGYAAAASGERVPLGEGVIGVAASTRQVVTVPNVARSRVMQTAIDSGAAARDDGRKAPMPSLADARSVAAVPLLAQAEVAGVLYLESREQGAFGAQNERLLRVVGAHLASVLRSLDSAGIQEGSVRGADEEPAAAGERLSVTYYQADDSVFVGDEYVIKGVPGRILWKLLREHAANGREAFTNRELRLDERLGLPPGNDNLEARLLVLRKRLAGGAYGIALERTGRGRLRLSVSGALELSEVATSGPMRAAHAPNPSE
jgi:putative methionine-R-sulfoxide reductase with GAF domain